MSIKRLIVIVGPTGSGKTDLSIRLALHYRAPILFLTYDSQTSDTGLDTRLEAFYDMLAMRKERTI